MRCAGGLRALFASAIAVALVVSSAGTAWTARATAFSSHVDPSLRAGEVALVRTTYGHAGALSSTLAGLGAVDITTSAAADTVVARLSSDALAAITTDPNVTVATRDLPIVALDGGRGGTGYESNDTKSPDGSASTTTSLTSAGLLAIRGPQAWTTTTGAGVTVAVMDTGIADHPDLPEGKVKARLDFVRDGDRRDDPGGHGTFIAGLIAANGATKGVAPDARLVSLRVLDGNGNGTLAGVVAAFDWLLRHHDAYEIDVVNISWGAPQATSYHKDILSALVEAAWFSGITVVAAAGNDGAVTSPASDPFVVTVGSFSDAGTAMWRDDTFSTFSGQGPTLDGFTKPEILAPGEHVSSLRVPGLTYLDKNGAPVGSSTDLYVKMTGTSASAGFTSGVAALVAAAREGFTPGQTKGAIVAGGRDVRGTKTPGIDALNALTARPAKVSAGIAPSRLLLTLLARAHQLTLNGVTWEGVTWDGVTWEGVTWDGVTWESVSWESVSWESVSWESITWEGVTWAKVIQ